MRADLLIGIGNPLRGDDGVGGALLEELAEERGEWSSPAMELRAVQQLTPEVALAVAGAGRVLFVDAWVAPEGAEPWIEALRPAGREPHRPALGGLGDRGDLGGMGELAGLGELGGSGELADRGELGGFGGTGSHGLDPLALVAVAEALYGWRGEAALLRVPAFAFPHGLGFSEPLERALPLARRLVRQWLGGG